MSELPTGWDLNRDRAMNAEHLRAALAEIEAKFTDFLDIQGGTQPPKSQFFESYMDGLIRLLQIRDFGSDDKAIYIQSFLKIALIKDLFFIY
jgi:hypothetical protein